ncbi:MAG: hypothetical protein HYX75_15495 [Acidobacteria bacterium]|nr:hypothetical protein [Acidobacteriota bacterium]
MASALDPQKALTQYGLNAWQIEQGLPENAVYALTQTDGGYLWVGTEDGLVRFDGMRFKSIEAGSTGRLASNYVRALHQDARGDLWIGTYGGGLSRLRGHELVTFTTSEGLASDKILAIHEDAQGALWVGTDAGLNKITTSHVSTITTRDGLESDRVFSICEDPDGAIWAGTNGGGVSRLKDGMVRSYTTRQGLSSDLVRCLAADSDGTIWIGTEAGLNRLKDGDITILTTRDGLPGDWVSALLKDRDGALWAGTTGGLCRLANGRIATLGAHQGLTNENVRCLYEDREGSVWIGTYGGGLNRLRDGKFKTISTREGLADDLTWAICEDAHGSIWIGTDGGLNRLKDGKIDRYSIADGLSSDKVVSLYADGRGTMWIGTEGGGLNALVNGRFKVYSTRSGLSHDRVSCITEDRQGDVWIGTLGGGLNRLRGGTFTSYTIKDGLSNNSISFVHEDRNGDLWIGTSGGLNRFENGRFTSSTTSRGRSSELLNSVYEDTDGNLWMGTHGNGLALCREGKLVFVTTADGLFHDAVYKVLEDGFGTFWLTCNKGVFTVRKNELLDLVDGKTTRVHCTAYGLPDGMRSIECNGGMQGCGLRSRDGRLWVPTICGVVVIDPGSITSNPLPPPVWVEELTVDESQIVLGGADSARALDLRPGVDRYELHYTALSLVVPERVAFRYMLEGFDRSWVDAGTRRTAYYTRIPPGWYTFRVKACNNDGVWNEIGASVRFRVMPLYYQTRWFYALCLASAFLLGWGLYALRIRQIRMRFVAVLGERQRISRDIHDTLAQGLMAVSIQLDAVQRAWGKSEEAFGAGLSRAREHIRGTLAEVRRSVLDLRSMTLEQQGLSQALEQAARESSTGSKLHVVVETGGVKRRLPYDVEANLLRIAQEAITNAIRHSGGSKVQLELRYEERQVRLSVKDDGKGLALPVNAGHYGLLGMQERAENLGGSFSARSQPDGGAEIEVIVPAP